MDFLYNCSKLGDFEKSLWPQIATHVQNSASVLFQQNLALLRFEFDIPGLMAPLTLHFSTLKLPLHRLALGCYITLNSIIIMCNIRENPPPQNIT